MRSYSLVIKRLCAISALFFSGLAIAQSLPRFGTAKFGGGRLWRRRACLTRSLNAPVGNHHPCSRTTLNNQE